MQDNIITKETGVLNKRGTGAIVWVVFASYAVDPLHPMWSPDSARKIAECRTPAQSNP